MLVRTPKNSLARGPGLPKLRQKRGHREAHADFEGENGSDFRVVLRRSSANPLAFSVILMVRVPNRSRWFRLRRYNGSNHGHRNLIERTRFRGFHMHTATERYQLAGQREDAYAEPSDRFSDFDGAVRCLIEDARLSVAAPGDATQLGLSLEQGP